MMELMTLAETLLENESDRRRVPGRILAVDDDPGNLEVLAGLLEDDYSIDTTPSCQKAMGLLESTEYDLVLSDQRMPGMTGVELLALVRQRYPETVRVIVSAYSDSRELLQCINQGHVFRYVMKPWTPEEMESVIRQGIERRYQRLAIRRLVDELNQRNSELTRTLADLRETQQQLVHSARLATIGQLTSSIAHELRNQLTVVRAAYDFIKDENISDDLRQMVGLGDMAVKNLLEMLRTVSSFARHRQWDIDASCVDLKQILNDSMIMLRMDARAKSRILEYTEPEGECDAHVDPIRLGQVVYNLLRNALDATSTGARISLSLEQSGRQWLIRVSDTGTGITEENLERVFNAFFTTKENGIGLGLAICKQIVEAHNGSLEVNSRPGEGTTFTVRLPHPCPEDS